MEYIQNLVEYYDELYPTTESIQNFYGELLKKYRQPVKVLDIASGTGTLEFYLAKKGCDVTGIEVSQPLLDSAILRRRTQLLSIRFFKLSTVEMSKFLGKDFYNMISCLNNRLSYMRTKDKMQQFFKDCKDLLKKDGTLVLQLFNFDSLEESTSVEFPTRSSIRVKLYTTVDIAPGNIATLDQKLETGNGKFIPIMQNEPIYPLKREEITQFAKEAGFTSCEFYADFDRNPIEEDSPEIVCVLSC